MHGGQVIGGQGHQLAGGPLLKKGAVEDQQLAEELAPDVPFHQPGKSQDQVAPEKAEECHPQAQADDRQAVAGEGLLVERAGPQAIDAQFGHPGDEELTEIDADQGQDAKGYAQPVSLEQRQDQG